eukprot:gene27870-12047_t
MNNKTAARTATQQQEAPIGRAARTAAMKNTAARNTNRKSNNNGLARPWTTPSIIVSNDLRIMDDASISVSDDLRIMNDTFISVSDDLRIMNDTFISVSGLLSAKAIVGLPLGAKSAIDGVAPSPINPFSPTADVGNKHSVLQENITLHGANLYQGNIPTF